MGNNLQVRCNGLYLLKNGLRAEVYAIEQKKELYFTRVYEENGQVRKLLLYNSYGKVAEADSEGRIILVTPEPVDRCKYLQYDMVRAVSSHCEDMCSWEYWDDPKDYWATNCGHKMPRRQRHSSYLYCPFCGLKIK